MNLQVPAPVQAPFVSSAQVREWLVEQLRLDLVGPGPADTALHNEALPQAPSRWYLTGFLVPLDAPEEQRAGDADAEGNLDSGDDMGGSDDAATPDQASGRKTWRPSSMGLSFLLNVEATVIEVEIIWGDYGRIERPEGSDEGEDGRGDGSNGRLEWQRVHRAEKVTLSIAEDGRSEHPAPRSDGLELSMLVRPAILGTEQGDRKVKAISVFLVNRRIPAKETGKADEAFAFQTVLSISSSDGFLPRGDIRGVKSDDWDECLADLHYRDVADYAVGHNVAAEWMVKDGKCSQVSSACMPLVPVPRVIPNPDIPHFELGMEVLGQLADAADAKAKLSGVVEIYRAWIEEQRKKVPALSTKRQEVARTLLDDAIAAGNRVEDGINCLDQTHALEAFRIANRTMARAARQRESQIRGIAPKDASTPRWRPFQLAFILLNLRGLTEPTHSDRDTVNLLFFPTGGGKTEAYLGLAAFAIAYRRLVNPGLTGAGLSVLMRYTLRLLTLDQLGRASALICALELERQSDMSSPKKLGDWPIEIGLWVGRAATPNHMGHQGDNDTRHVTARWRVLDYIRRSNKPLPVPIRTCPWCGTPFCRDSF